MSARTEQGWTRREFAGVAALIALAAGLPIGAVRLSALPDDEAPDPAMRAFMREVSQLVIPRTATAGAGDVGTGDFVLLALAHGLDGTRDPVGADAMPALGGLTRPDGSLRHAQWLVGELNRRAGGKFATHPGRAKILAAFDAEAFTEANQNHPWRKIKGLILTGYYTSEVGGSHELRYELVPGRFDPDLPATPQTVAFSSDWTAVDFG